VTGDNPETAHKIAAACGLLTPDGVCMEGKEYRALNPAQRDDVSRRLDVLSRAVPQDKLLLVTTLEVRMERYADGRQTCMPVTDAAVTTLARGPFCLPCRRSTRPWR